MGVDCCPYGCRGIGRDSFEIVRVRHVRADAFRNQLTVTWRSRAITEILRVEVWFGCLSVRSGSRKCAVVSLKLVAYSSDRDTRDLRGPARAEIQKMTQLVRNHSILDFRREFFVEKHAASGFTG